MSALGRVVTVAVLLVSVLIMPAGAAGGCPGQSAELTGATGTWTTFDLPTFSAGPPEVTAHAGDSSDAGSWWVTNGISVSRSVDAGCSWREVLVLPTTPTADIPANRSTDRIRSLAAAGGRLVAAVDVVGSGPRVPVVVNGEDPPAARATVVLTGRDELRAAAPLTAPAGAPGPAAAAPSDPDVLYAVAGGLVHASEDGGASWRLATPPNTAVGAALEGSLSFTTDGSAFPSITRLAVDPTDAAALWVRARGQVFRTVDAGRSYEVLVDTTSATFPVLEVGRTRGTRPRVTLVEQEQFDTPVTALRLSDDGTTLVRSKQPLSGLAQSGASGPGREDFVLTTSAPAGRGAEVYVLSGGDLLPVDEFRLGPLQDVEQAGSSSYVFRGGSRLTRWEPPAGGVRLPAPPAPSAAPDVGAIGPGLPPLSGQTVLSSPVTEVRLLPGQSTSVPLLLDLAPEPTPLDVFFMLDTSRSMEDVVAGLAAGFADLARELGRSRIDAQFGLGEYQDWEGVRYRRLVPVSPPGEELRRALESIRTAGGAEPAYTALHQMLTGSGIDEPSTGEPVDPGQQAAWRDGSLRVVVHATDESVSDRDPDGPRKVTVLRALQRERVRHVGIEVVRPLVQQVNEVERDVLGPGELFAQLAEISGATAAFAPPGGVDCDGDGDLDLQEGAPLVCALYPGGGQVALAEPLQRVLATLEDVQPVSIVVDPPTEAAGLRTQVVADPDTPAEIDVKKPAQLTYALNITCDATQAGTSRSLALRPRVGSRLGMALRLGVVCEPLLAPTGEPPLQPAAPAQAALPALAVALPVPPLPPPVPANAPAPANAPVGAQAAAPAANPAPGVAMAPEEEQVQLAFAEQKAQHEVQELAMVARDEGPNPAAIRLLAMSVICAVATGAAMQRRSATVRTAVGQR